MIEKCVRLICLCPNFEHGLSLLSVLTTFFSILSNLRTFGIEKLRYFCSFFNFFLHFPSSIFFFRFFLLRFFVRVFEGKSKREKERKRKREKKRKKEKERNANIWTDCVSNFWSFKYKIEESPDVEIFLPFSLSFSDIFSSLSVRYFFIPPLFDTFDTTIFFPFESIQNKWFVCFIPHSFLFLLYSLSLFFLSVFLLSSFFLLFSFRLNLCSFHLTDRGSFHIPKKSSGMRKREKF